MVGDRGEVERAALELDLEAGRVVDRLAARELVGVVGGRAHVEDERVERVLGVDVEVAEVGLARSGAAGLRPPRPLPSLRWLVGAGSRGAHAIAASERIAASTLTAEAVRRCMATSKREIR